MLKYFLLKEFIPKQLWESEGEQSIAKMDYRILETMDRLREFFNSPIIVNTWHSGGKLQYRGYRPIDCNVGAKNSAHKKGLACDFNVVGLQADFVRKEILKNQYLFPNIKRLENDTSWIHIDCVDTGKKEIILFNP